MKARIIGTLQREQPMVRWMQAMTDDLEEMGEKFDVITLYHVLEHLTDPVSSLKRILRVAGEGALLVIEVPNAGGWEAKIKNRRWHYYKVDHVNYFRPKDLRRLAVLCGLKVLDVRGYQHFSYPQGVLWKDLIKGGLAGVGFRDVVSIFLQLPS